ncbi:MAG: hypothetical protein EI684_19290 [Candidatus Viridilinea halotolerans]|uniref:Uncharacterized protein n=1 Tax=Candidatus Viridilinea halotolerans TaxID=2491704 RepID=A0A426TSS4_9CHLR|nr:MAG: hypothetical protein EI684_19290 [Candidatus Viridilinea halotolerans]
MTTPDPTASAVSAHDQPAHDQPAHDQPAAPDVSLVTKIVLIEGDRFSVPYDTPVAQIRDTLRATFPGIGTARVQNGTLAIEGVTYETVEFTKQAGTKGSHPLAPMAQVARRPVPFLFHPHFIRDLRLGRFTFGEALAWELEETPPPHTHGATLCRHLDTVLAVPADGGLPVPGWSR